MPSKGYPLKADERNALRSWRRVHGRSWRQLLLDAWGNGRYTGVDDADVSALQRLRNRAGSAGLLRVRTDQL